VSDRGRIYIKFACMVAKKLYLNKNGYVGSVTNSINKCKEILIKIVENM
jgi:hypothetical protein